jgi:methyl acetate hydrolase
MVDTGRIAEPLRRAAEAGDVPGVVAAAATGDGVIFEGAFGSRDLATGAPMTTDTVGSCPMASRACVRRSGRSRCATC